MANSVECPPIPPRSARRYRRVVAEAPCTATKTKTMTTKKTYTRACNEPKPKHTLPASRRDRMLYYENEFRRCVRQDSQLQKWVKRVQQHGPPQPPSQGYKRVSRTDTPPSPVDNTHNFSLKSILLRKASTSSATSSRCSFEHPPPLAEPPKSSTSRFIVSSISRLASLSHRPSQSTARSLRRSKKSSTELESLKSKISLPLQTTKPPVFRHSTSTSTMLLDRLKSKTWNEPSRHSSVGGTRPPIITMIPVRA